MGTRSTTTVYDGDTPILSFYRQYDGYPSGHGQDIADFLSGKAVVNGISGNGADILNGPGDAAVRLLTAIKNEHGGEHNAGGLYAIPHEQAKAEEYHYDVVVTPVTGWGESGTPGSIFVRVFGWGGNLLAEGSPEEFVALAEQAEGIDA